MCTGHARLDARRLPPTTSCTYTRIHGHVRSIPTHILYHAATALPPATPHPHPICPLSYDLYQLGKDGISSKPKTASGLAYAEEFRNLTHTWAALDVPVGKKIDHAAMLPACFKHCNTLKSTWQTLTVDGVTLQEAVTSWFFQEGGISSYLEDTCEGWNCGPGCA